MQMTKAEVYPAELQVRKAVRMAGLPPIDSVTAVFVRIETRKGQSAWGCTIAHPNLTGEKPEDVLRQCREIATLIPDMHPTNIEYSLTRLVSLANPSPGAKCAFDLAFHNLLGLAAGMPLYRILGGFRNRIQTSVTIPLAPLGESIELARLRANEGFMMLKIKGGSDPGEDVRRVQAIHQALPHLTLRLDADGGYNVQEALDVARVLDGILEMLEQPTPAADLPALRQVKELSPVPVLADQSLRAPASALDLAANHMVNGISIKLVTCGGFQCARQVDAIARAAHLAAMIGCFIEPSLLIAAGLSLALSSPNVKYADLDGCFDLVKDPSHGGFHLEDGWLTASEESGLGTRVDLG